MSPSPWPVVIFNQRANGPSRARSAHVVLLRMPPPVSQRGRSTPPISGWADGDASAQPGPSGATEPEGCSAAALPAALTLGTKPQKAPRQALMLCFPPLRS